MICIIDQNVGANTKISISNVAQGLATGVFGIWSELSLDKEMFSSWEAEPLVESNPT